MNYMFICIKQRTISLISLYVYVLFDEAPCKDFPQVLDTSTVPDSTPILVLVVLLIITGEIVRVSDPITAPP